MSPPKEGHDYVVSFFFGFAPPWALHLIFYLLGRNESARQGFARGQNTLQLASAARRAGPGSGIYSVKTDTKERHSFGNFF